jgi:hypothetical protein
MAAPHSRDSFSFPLFRQSLIALVLLMILKAASVSGLTTHNEWTQVPLQVQVPTARAFHTCTLIEAPCGPVLLVFGGAFLEPSGQFTYVDNTWIFDLQLSRWYPNMDRLLIAPHERAGHVAVLFDNFTVALFGGQNESTTLADVWIFTVDPNPFCNSFTVIGGWEPALITCADGLCPESRWGHSALMLGSHMYMVGGSTTPWSYTASAASATYSFCNMTLWRLSRTASGFAWATVPAYSSSGLPPPRAGAFTTVIGPDSFLLAAGWASCAFPSFAEKHTKRT